jgi:polyhydroxyalkanoate synthesis regulator phasin
MINRRLASIALVGILAITTPVSSLAAEKTGSVVKDRSTYSVSALYKSALDTLVSEGTISSDQEETIISTMTPKYKASEKTVKHTNPFESLVTAGTITEDQLTAINTALQSMKDSDKTMDDILDSLVAGGTITSTQEEAIVDAMPSWGERSNNKNTTAANKKPTSRFESLVTAGTITKDQLTAIETALKSAKRSDKTIEDILSSLVTNGTITTTQEKAIMDGMPSREDRSQNRDTAVANKKPSSRFESLVTAGTITEDQLTAVQTALKTALESTHKSN